MMKNNNRRTWLKEKKHKCKKAEKKQEASKV